MAWISRRTLEVALHKIRARRPHTPGGTAAFSSRSLPLRSDSWLARYCFFYLRSRFRAPPDLPVVLIAPYSNTFSSRSPTPGLCDHANVCIYRTQRMLPARPGCHRHPWCRAAPCRPYLPCGTAAFSYSCVRNKAKRGEGQRDLRCAPDTVNVCQQSARRNARHVSAPIRHG